VLTLSQEKSPRAPAREGHFGRHDHPRAISSQRRHSQLHLQLHHPPRSDRSGNHGRVPANDYRRQPPLRESVLCSDQLTSSTPPVPGFAFGHIARSNISYSSTSGTAPNISSITESPGWATPGSGSSPSRPSGSGSQATPIQLYVDTPSPRTGGPQKSTASLLAASRFPLHPIPTAGT